MVKPITVKKTDEFFISLATVRGHSFVLAGVNSGGKTHILARVGKVVAHPEEFSCKSMVKEGKLVSSATSAESIIADEGIFHSDRYRSKISYSAYSISYDQYLHFIDLVQQLESVENRNLIRCFKPCTDEYDEVTLKYQRANTAITDQITREMERCAKVKSKTTRITINNTCRHSAIDLLNYVRNDAPLANNVSNQFFRDLPLQTELIVDLNTPFFEKNKNRVNQKYLIKPSNWKPFYILPPPPPLDLVKSNSRAEVLVKIYQQMEHLLKKNPNSRATFNKFNALKQLYTQEMGINDESLSDLLNKIRLWKRINQEHLGLRQRFWFDKFLNRKSTTEKMLDQVELNLKTKVWF